MRHSLLPWITGLQKTILLLFLIISPVLYGGVQESAQLALFSSIALLFFLQLIRGLILSEIKAVRFSLAFPFVVFFALSCASACFSVYFFAGKIALVKMAFFALLFYVLVSMISERRDVFILIYTLTGIGCLLSILGIWRYFHGEGFIALIWPYAAFSTFTTVSHFGAYIAILIPFAVSFMLAARNKFFPFLAVSILSAGFFFGFDKGALVQLIASLFLLAVLLKRAGSLNLSKGSLIFILVIAAAVFSGGILQMLSGLFTADFAHSPDPTLWKRWLHWQDALRMISQRPFLGWGLDTFKFVYPMFKNARLTQFVEFAHQEYLQMAAEIGVIGLCAFLWGIFAVLGRAVQGLRSGYKDDLKSVIAAGVSSCAGLMLHNLYDFNFHIPAINVCFITALCGIIKALDFQKKRGGADKSDLVCPLKIGWRAALAPAVLSAILVVYSGIFLFRGYYSNIYLQKAGLFYDNLELSRAKEELIKSIRLNPENISAIKTLGAVFAVRSRFNAEEERKSFYEAERLYKDAAAINQMDADAHLRLAKLYAAHQKDQAALKEFKKAVSLEPGSPFYRDMLGDFYLRKGIPAYARRAYEKALALNPGDDYARERLGRLAGGTS